MLPRRLDCFLDWLPASAACHSLSMCVPAVPTITLAPGAASGQATLCSSQSVDHNPVTGRPAPRSSQSAMRLLFVAFLLASLRLLSTPAPSMTLRYTAHQTQPPRTSFTGHHLNSATTLSCPPSPLHPPRVPSQSCLQFHRQKQYSLCLVRLQIHAQLTPAWFQQHPHTSSEHSSRDYIKPPVCPNFCHTNFTTKASKNSTIQYTVTQQ
uniref:Uncharacterized protein n=1 Tax=Knipowitschia caucasica TaxID=637954 RepID=A0AAV2LU90_KNICA